ncbi:conserved exported hypothetical protein [Candidatus Sulfotelmatobacter kueseliae]|uniref:DUF885 domain-containing protein n=1 Tax=Candidatus Sulfotelmatobacter kueseliae TaxID=2042962 RepID=A0A2U3KWY1_9BACT|nr:conserved exported hypothetical protein [Candidatus Sulfotelmatobacter kueseliae]
MNFRVRPAVGSVALICCALMLMPSSVAQNGPPALSSLENRRQQLLSLFDEEWQYELRTNPEFATVLGDPRYNDRLRDNSPEFFQSDLEQERRFLARFEAIDPAGFSEQDTLSRELMIRELRQEIEGAQFKPWEMPVNQMGGPHLEMPDLVVLTPFNTVVDYENYVARLRQIPRLFDQVMANMRQGMRDGLMPPRYLLEKVAAEADGIAGNAGEASPFAVPLKKFPAAVPQADQKRLREAVLATIDGQVVPAYQHFANFVRNEYAPRGRTDPGLWALPDGAARYRFAIRRVTTTDLTPDQIHELGLKQVAEVEAEMLAVAHQLGFKDLASLNDHIKNERRFYATSGQQLLDLYAGYARDMEPELPKLFGRLPKSKLAVIPMEASRSKNAVPADYTDGTADGSRPGHINVNEWDPEHRLVLNVEAIAYHEGIPGHHLQLSLAQEMQDLPAFRQHAGYTAFVEGWALYAERLGKEVGRYQDPYSNYGRLENEMWRAIRLVIDTGVHEKRWTRDQMVDYFHRYTAMDEPNVQSEVDRYIAWPGQALAYKLGQLEILKLREAAQKQLGPRFDLRAFHDEVLANGALPLDVLDSGVTAWIKSQH